MNKKLKSMRILAAVVAILVILALAARCGLSPSSRSKTENEKVTKSEVAEGVKALEDAAGKDVEEAQKEVDYYVKSQKLEFYNSGNYEALFAGCMIMGDSHAEGFSSYGLLPESMVAATVGKDVNNNDEDRAQVIAAKPSTLYIVYGQNTIQRCSGNVEKAAEEYRKFLDTMQASLPDTKIVVCSVFKVQDAALAKKPELGKAPELNKLLSKMCDEKGWKFIDTNPLLTDQYYEPDHIHTNKAYHKLWLNYVAAESGLIDLEATNG